MGPTAPGSGNMAQRIQEMEKGMNEETKELLKEIKEYRDGMVVRNLPFQWISDIITKWEMKEVKTTSEKLQDELEPINEKPS